MASAWTISWMWLLQQKKNKIQIGLRKNYKILCITRDYWYHSLDLATFQDLQNKANSIIKVNKIPELQFCSQTNNDIGLWPGDYKQGLERQQSDLTRGADALPETFSQLELRTAVTGDFPALFKSGCRQIQFGDVCIIALFCCFYFLFSFNVSTLKVD